MKPFRSFVTDETKNSVSQYLQEFEDAVVSTHERIERNGHTFFTPRTFDKKVPNKMIISALQGDEPAGWMGLLEFVKNNKPKNVNVTYVPIFSKETFESGEHEDDANENPNHNIPYDPSREAKRFLTMQEYWLPLASGGFIDLHEDPYREEGYAFVWSDRGDLGDRIVSLIGENFNLFHEPRSPIFATNGKIQNDDQGMLGDYMSKLGVSPSITSETPVVNTDLNKRIDVNIKIIREFLDD